MKSQETIFTLNTQGTIQLLERPKIMGILNVTPDSFSDGGQFFSIKNAILHVEKLISEGADIIDIGAQSTRPNAEFISAKQEIDRLGKIIMHIKKEFPKTVISLDTFYADVVRFAAAEGVDVVNDISGGQYDAEMLKTVADLGLPYVLMHVNERYSEMHDKKIDGDVIPELNRYFSKKINQLYDLGIKDIVLDPGIGFGKTISQNHQILDELHLINFGKSPVLVGISRKSFIYKPLGKLPTEIVEETQKLHLKALENGANILRVHDVAATKQTVDAYLKFS
ncbi:MULTISPECIES: dihydropteroate synthase [Amniculibacterium]|jgi:dihydropteroate synthase|uniref:dihydropteroate synthase n=1 Tax=Amniculibacterium TaxID=2715289 RepID=UPI000F596F44|nr:MULTISPECIES: dihydropteroate synthase [Amniculibacterium]